MDSQRGVALLTALLIVSLAATAAVAMASRLQIGIRQTGNTLQFEQASLYVDGVESWACRVLQEDRQDNELDHDGEDWATQLPPMPVEGGAVAGSIEDLQGRFNLNNLVRDGTVDSAALLRFRRLLQILETDPAIAEALADWLDGDAEVRFPDGAEDSVYLGMERPYRAANRRMVSASELRLLPGVTAEVLERLYPHVTALPEPTTLNVNTAGAELLMSLSDEIDRATAEALIAARGEEGYASVDEFVAQPQLQGKLLPVEALSVSTRYFALASHVEFGRISVNYQSLIQRTDKQAQVIMRARDIL